MSKYAEFTLRLVTNEKLDGNAPPHRMQSLRAATEVCMDVAGRAKTGVPSMTGCLGLLVHGT